MVPLAYIPFVDAWLFTRETFLEHDGFSQVVFYYSIHAADCLVAMYFPLIEGSRLTVINDITRRNRVAVIRLGVVLWREHVFVVARKIDDPA